MDNKTTKITATLSLETIGIITFIVFLILKLTGTWSVSWFWIWFPLWIPVAISLSIYLIIFLVVLIIVLITRRKDDD